MDGFSGMTGPQRRRVDDLERKVADLSRALASLSGPGVTTRGGAVEVRPVQVGFRGEITGAWDPATGYPWERHRLDGVAFVDPAVMPTGTGAVAVDGNTSLAAGTVGWFEPSPDAQGLVFVAAGGGSGGGGGGCAGGCGTFAQNLHRGIRLKLTVVSKTGACGCVPDEPGGAAGEAQWADLVYDHAERLWKETGSTPEGVAFCP